MCVVEEEGGGETLRLVVRNRYWYCTKEYKSSSEVRKGKRENMVCCLVTVRIPLASLQL